MPDFAAVPAQITMNVDGSASGPPSPPAGSLPDWFDNFQTNTDADYTIVGATGYSHTANGLSFSSGGGGIWLPKIYHQKLYACRMKLVFTPTVDATNRIYGFVSPYFDSSHNSQVALQTNNASFRRIMYVSTGWGNPTGNQTLSLTAGTTYYLMMQMSVDINSTFFLAISSTDPDNVANPGSVTWIASLSEGLAVAPGLCNSPQSVGMTIQNAGAGDLVESFSISEIRAVGSSTQN